MTTPRLAITVSLIDKLFTFTSLKIHNSKEIKVKYSKFFFILKSFKSCISRERLYLPKLTSYTPRLSIQVFFLKKLQFSDLKEISVGIISNIDFSIKNLTSNLQQKIVIIFPKFILPFTINFKEIKIFLNLMFFS